MARKTKKTKKKITKKAIKRPIKKIKKPAKSKSKSKVKSKSKSRSRVKKIIRLKTRVRISPKKHMGRMPKLKKIKMRRVSSVKVRKIKTKDVVLVLDFGSQYTQLIARRIRENKVYSRIVPYKISIEEIKEINPKGIILSGGPMSVYDDGAPMP